MAPPVCRRLLAASLLYPSASFSLRPSLSLHGNATCRPALVVRAGSYGPALMHCPFICRNMIATATQVPRSDCGIRASQRKSRAGSATRHGGQIGGMASDPLCGRGGPQDGQAAIEAPSKRGCQYRTAAASHLRHPNNGRRRHRHTYQIPYDKLSWRERPPLIWPCARLWAA